jgi:hypothetical protein
MCRHLLEVVASREKLPRRRDHDDANAGVLRRRIELGLQGLHRLERQGVGGRIVQRQATDGAWPPNADGLLVGHTA